MSWIDAHCHLSDPRVARQELNHLLEKCRQAGLTRFVLGGVSPEEWRRQDELAQAHPGVFQRVFGLHPWWVHDRAVEGATSLIEEGLSLLETRLPEVSALGETGLDAGRDRLKKSRQAQVGAFEAQLDLAAKQAKPVVLHIVRAHPLALGILRERRQKLAASGGWVHSFSGTWADARHYLDLGLSLSISARVTYPDARDLHETVLKAPWDRLIFETDAPDQPPYGAIEKVHTPLSLLKVVRKASEIRSEPPDQLLDRSRDTILRILRL